MGAYGQYEAIFAVLERAVATGVIPGAVAYVWREGAVSYHEAHGVLATDPASSVCGVAVDRETRYDLASLTKVLATTTVAATMVDAGALRLDAPLPPPFGAHHEGATARDLLEHAAGFEAHVPFYAPLLEGRDAVLRAVASRPAVGRPRAAAVYSDLGFMALGAWLEWLGKDRLDRLTARALAPFIHELDTSVPTLGFRPVDAAATAWADERRIAPTEVYVPGPPPGDGDTRHLDLRRARGPVAHGEVHDDNCLVMGGVAGHAGMFGTAEAVGEVAQAWLEDRIPGISPATRELFWRPSTVPGSTRRLGWDGVDPDGSGSTGTSLSAAAVGHLGFTGCSLWIDPEQPGIYVLLTNRVHPSREDPAGIRALRRAFHAAASGRPAR